MTWVSDSVGVLIMSLAFLGVIALAESWSRLGSPPPEWPRKLLHGGGGTVCLFFPFLISSAWLVLIMALVLSALFAIGRYTAPLRCLESVERHTHGAEYYPVAVFLLFLIATGRPWLFVCSMLVLAVSDASAALIGSSYGRVLYAVGEGSKSLEGSAAFLVVSFLVIHLPMLLMTDLSRATCVLAALLVALLVTGFEAISTRGTDNLFVPLGTCVILGRLTGKPEAELVFQLISLLTLCLVIAFLAWRSRSFDTAGAIALMLFVYGAWSLGSVIWGAPILLGVLVYVVIWMHTPGPKWNAEGVKARLVAHAAAVPMMLVVCANCTRAYAALYGPYLSALTVMFTFVFWKHMRIHAGERMEAGRPSLPVCCVGAWLVTTPVPAALPCGANLAMLSPLAAALPTCLIANWYQQRTPRPTQTGYWRASDFVTTVTAALATLLLQYAHILPAWRALS